MAPFINNLVENYIKWKISMTTREGDYHYYYYHHDDDEGSIIPMAN